VGRPEQSRTALGVAAERAVLTDMEVLSDPFARKMLNPGMAKMLRVVEHLPHRIQARSVTLAGLAARVLWFDGQLRRALEAGITQVVTVGAGYDSRAWRFRRDGVTFFELDHPVTQREKMLRAPGPGPIYVEADLRTQDAAEALLEGGLDSSRPAMFILEGVTMYLPEKTLRSVLMRLEESSAGGSRLAVDFHPPTGAGTSRNRRQQRLQRFARTGSGEHIRLTVDRPDAIALVEHAAWVVNEVLSMRAAGHALVPAHSGLPVGAINKHKTLVAGLHS